MDYLSEAEKEWTMNFKLKNLINECKTFTNVVADYNHGHGLKPTDLGYKRVHFYLGC